MSNAIGRLAGFSSRHPGPVLAGWVALLAVVGVLLVTMPRSIATTFSLTGTPSQAVLDTIATQVPGAAGAQGTLVITAADGSRLDTPERLRAIARAADRAVRTGHVVDREARLADQRAEVITRVTDRVEEKVADQVSGTLGQLATTLAASADRTGLAAPAQLAARARELQLATPHDRIAGTSALLADLDALRENARTMGLSPESLGLPTPTGTVEDPAVAVDEAVAAAAAPILADLDRLASGSAPMGRPLTVDDRTLSTVRISDDGRTALLPVQFTAALADLPDHALEDVLIVTADAVAGVGLSPHPSTSLAPTEPPIGGHEAIGVGVAVVVLWLALGSLVAAGLPLLTALVGVAIGVGGAVALSGSFVMTTATPALGLMIGLAVGIDYALFIVHRHRRLVLDEGLSPMAAIPRAASTAGSAVLFAGLTVITALLALLTLGIPFVTTMALTAAATVALSVGISLTALPALLRLAAHRTSRRRRPPTGSIPGVPASGSGAPASGSSAPAPGSGAPAHPVATRWVRLVTARPWVTITLVAVGLGLLATLAGGLRLGMPSGATAAATSGPRLNHDATTAAFGEGANAPLVVTLRHDDGSPFATDELLARQAELEAIDGVTGARLMGAAPDRTLALFQAVPRGGPTDPATEDLVHRLRATDLDGVEPLGVTGMTALNLDLTDVLAEDTPIYIAVVVLISLIILVLVFRSLLVPLAATAGFLLAIGATLGLVSTAFGDDRFLWLVGVDRAGPILSFLPIMATGILYGLAMDYQVFLGTAMRESHLAGIPAREAVRAGFRRVSLVVVAAAVIMVSVFGGFVLGDDTTVRQFGFALSAGILIDAFLIRMALMPALLTIAGERAWWFPRLSGRRPPRREAEDAARRPDLVGVP